VDSEYAFACELEILKNNYYFVFFINLQQTSEPNKNESLSFGQTLHKGRTLLGRDRGFGAFKFLLKAISHLLRSMDRRWTGLDHVGREGYWDWIL